MNNKPNNKPNTIELSELELETVAGGGNSPETIAAGGCYPSYYSLELPGFPTFPKLGSTNDGYWEDTGFQENPYLLGDTSKE